MSQHVLILDYLHVFNDQRMLLQAEALASLGYRVTVIGTVRFGVHPAHSSANGVDFFIVPLVATYHPLKLLVALWRLLRGDVQNVIPLPEAAPRRGNVVSLLFYWLWLLRLGLAQNIHAVWCHEHFPLPAAWLLARLKRVPLVYDEHDFIGALGFYEGSKGRLAARVEAFFLPRLDAVTTVGERLADSLRQHGARRVVAVGSWRRLEDYAIDPARVRAERERLGLTASSLIITYISTFSPSRYLPELLAAVENTPDVTLLVGGSGQPEWEQMVAAAAGRSANIRYLGWVNRADIPLYTLVGDAVYHCLDSCVDPQMYFAAPNKLFEAFAAGKPVIARRGIGEMADILQAEDAGYLLDEVTPETLQAAFVALRDPALRERLQANARAASARYNWSVARDRLGALMADLLTPA